MELDDIPQSVVKAARDAWETHYLDRDESEEDAIRAVVAAALNQYAAAGARPPHAVATVKWMAEVMAEADSGGLDYKARPERYMHLARALAAAQGGENV